MNALGIESVLVTGDELTYFAGSVLSGRAPSIITPEDSMEAVRACLAAEQSAATGHVIGM